MLLAECLVHEMVNGDYFAGEDRKHLHPGFGFSSGGTPLLAEVGSEAAQEVRFRQGQSGTEPVLTSVEP